MDKSTIIGLVLIVLIFVGFYYINKPSDEQIAEMKRQDSIRKSELLIKDSLRQVEKAEKTQQAYIQDSINGISQDTLSVEQKQAITDYNLTSQYGIFKNSANGQEKIFTVENEKMKISFTNRGGKIYSVELKEFQTYHGYEKNNQEHVVLFVNDSSSVFGLELLAQGKPLITNKMYFEPIFENTNNSDIIKVGDEPLTVKMRLAVEEGKYIEYEYTIKPDDYLIDFNINIAGLKEELKANTSIKIRWDADIPSLERGNDWESNNTTIYMKMLNGDIEYLSETPQKANYDGKGTSAKWIAHKQQFFSSIIIAEDKIDNPIAFSEKIDNPSDSILKKFKTEFSFSIQNNEEQQYKFGFYFGPNKFSILKQYGQKLEKIVPLGWGIFGWVNRFIVIPIFNWLGSFMSNFGLIILLLTLIIKVILFPFTYKSYKSTAKMRYLKPQIDEINKKIPKEKAMERQQETMKLYKKTGVSPMGGCLPMLLQLPILFALFRFFPASIELRQKSFLWADDLSSYDSIWSFDFNIPFYGDHISLFTLLMAVSMILSTRLTSSSQPSSSSMPGMKTMMYLMPIMMLFWFNNYSSGLSYYYFLANLITIIQTMIIQKYIVTEEKVLAEMEANKLKVKTKSKFQMRLEEAAKHQQQMRNRKK